MKLKYFSIYSHWRSSLHRGFLQTPNPKSKYIWDVPKCITRRPCGGNFIPQQKGIQNFPAYLTSLADDVDQVGRWRLQFLERNEQEKWKHSVYCWLATNMFQSQPSRTKAEAIHGETFMVSVLELNAAWVILYWQKCPFRSWKITSRHNPYSFEGLSSSFLHFDSQSIQTSTYNLTKSLGVPLKID